MTDAIDRVKLVYFMLGLMLSGAVFLNVMVLATPQGNGAPSNPESFMALSEDRTANLMRVPVLAVGERHNTGDVAAMTVQGIPGNSNIYLRTSPYVDPTLQQSSNTAAHVARGYAGDEEMDFIITYEIVSSYLGGESSGAAKAIAMIAIYEDMGLEEGTIITGTIYPNGRIGAVSGLQEKIEAASGQGFERILIPAAQVTIPFSERFSLRPSKEIGMEELIRLAEERFGIEVIPVRDIQEAKELMLI